MNKIWGIISILMNVCVCFSARAGDGGPIEHWDFRTVGGITPMQRNQVTVKELQLDIHLLPDGRRYEAFARYTLTNSGADTRVEYAVPISFKDRFYNSASSEKKSAKMTRYLNRKRKRIHIDVDGEPLSCRSKPPYYSSYSDFTRKTDARFGTKTASDGALMKTLTEFEEQDRVQYVLCSFEAHFPEKDDVVVNLRYVSDLLFKDEHWATRPLTYFSNRFLHQALFPAGFWHDDVGRVVVRLHPGRFAGSLEVVESQPRVKRPNLWVWSFTDVELASPPSLLVVVDSQRILEARELLTLNRFGSAPKGEKAVVAFAPSHLENYPPSNAVDGDKSTAWCIASGTKNKRLRATLKTEKQRYKSVVALSAGWVENDEIYRAHGRPTSIAIRRCGQERWRKHNIDWTKEPAASATRVLSIDTQEGHTLCFELTILSHAPGATHDDICISEFIIVNQDHQENKYSPGRW